MIFSNNRQDLRQAYYVAWQKYTDKQPLSALEKQLVSVMNQHPEYHGILNQAEKYADKDYDSVNGEVNPFLHMALHLSIHEQLSTQRPAIIVEVYQSLCQKMSHHEAEHQLMQCLSEAMWQQLRQVNPSFESGCYEQALQQLLK